MCAAIDLELENALERIDKKVKRKERKVEPSVAIEYQRLHDESGHQQPAQVLKMVQDGTKKVNEGITYKQLRYAANTHVCDACMLNAQRAKPKRKKVKVDQLQRQKEITSATTLSLRADLSHSGTIPRSDDMTAEEKLVDKDNKYALVITDQLTLYHWGTTFDDKAKAKEFIKLGVAHIAARLQKKVVELVTDSGREFYNLDLEEWAGNNAIRYRPLPPKQHGNNLAERIHGVSDAKARVLLYRARLGPWYRKYALKYALHLLNHSVRAAHGKKPIEFCGGASTIERDGDLIMFGERVAVLNDKSDRVGKTMQGSAYGIYLGIDSKTGAHNVLVPAATEKERPYLLQSVNVMRTHSYFYTAWSHEQALRAQRKVGKPMTLEEVKKARAARDAEYLDEVKRMAKERKEQEEWGADGDDDDDERSGENGVENAQRHGVQAPSEVLAQANVDEVKPPDGRVTRSRTKKQQQQQQSQPQSNEKAAEMVARVMRKTRQRLKEQEQAKRKAVVQESDDEAKHDGDTLRVTFPIEPTDKCQPDHYDSDGEAHWALEWKRPSKVPGFYEVKWVDYDEVQLLPKDCVDDDGEEGEAVSAIVEATATTTRQHISDECRENEYGQQLAYAPTAVRSRETLRRHLNDDGTFNYNSLLYERRAVAMMEEEIKKAAAQHRANHRESINHERSEKAKVELLHTINSIVEEMVKKHRTVDDGGPHYVYLVPCWSKATPHKVKGKAMVVHEAEATTVDEDGVQRDRRASRNKYGLQRVTCKMGGDGVVTVSAVVKKRDGTEEIITEPTTVREMLGHKMYAQCMEACKKEFASLVENGTWEAVPASTLTNTMQKAIKCKWVWKFKVNNLGEIDKVKARLVARGDMQKEGVDYNETFAATVKTKTIKIAAVLAVRYGLSTRQIDYTNAFLNGYVPETIYMTQPPLFARMPPPGESEPEVLKLVKAIYGIKQAPRIWNQLIDTFMKRMKFTALVADPGMYVRTSRTGRPIIVTLYVDDKMIMVHPDDEEEWGEIQREIETTFKITADDKCEWILRVSVQHDVKGRTMVMSQQRYIEEMGATYSDVLEQYRTTLKQLNNVAIDDSLTAEGGEKEEEQRVLSKSEHERYQQLVGSLLYASNLTRVDTCFQTNALARYMSAPRQQHMRAAVRVLRYLLDTKTRCLRYQLRDDDGREEAGAGGDDAAPVELVVYTDSDWASCLDSRRSTSGVLVTMNGLPVVWGSKRQKTVALSSTEAEYMAIAEGVKEALWLYNLLYQVEAVTRQRVRVQPTIVVRVDNQSAVALTKEGAPHQRTKHIDVRHHFVREQVASGRVKIEWISTHHQLADILTKRLPDDAFNRIRDHLLAPDATTPPTSLKQMRESADAKLVSKEERKKQRYEKWVEEGRRTRTESERYEQQRHHSVDDGVCLNGNSKVSPSSVIGSYCSKELPMFSNEQQSMRSIAAAAS